VRPLAHSVTSGEVGGSNPFAPILLRMRELISGPVRALGIIECRGGPPVAPAFKGEDMKEIAKIEIKMDSKGWISVKMNGTDAALLGMLKKAELDILREIQKDKK